MQKGKLWMALLPLLLAVSLSVLGLAYAKWYDVVQIEGTAEMGSLTIAFDPGEILGYEDNEPSLPVPKDVAWAEMYYEDYVVDPHTGKDGYKTLVVKIYNAYPCYEIHFTTIKILNIGTIPAHFTEITVEGFDVTDGTPLVFEWLPGFEYEKGVFKDDVDGDGELEEIINVEIVNFICHQLDPCHDTKGEIDLHFKQDAEECHTYIFKITIKAVQWNEA